jgi:hypothetical protein
MEFGMFCAQTGAHRECHSEEEAQIVWINAPRTTGTWCIVIGSVVVKEEEEE